MTSSGVVQIIGMSGTNDLHGTGLWNYDNQVMDARNNYDTVSAAIYRHQFGGSLGEPVLKNKLFWHLNGEATKQQITTAPQNVDSPQLSAKNCFRRSLRQTTTGTAAK